MEDYEQGLMSRREALRHIGAIVGSLMLATSILAACTPPARVAAPQAAPTVSTPVAVPATPSSPETRQVEFPGQGTTLIGYLAKPAGDGPFPAVLVCHENQGLTEHIKNVTRRLAVANYAGFPVDKGLPLTRKSLMRKR
jgi:carboxymethylenebutenolidase